MKTLKMLRQSNGWFSFWSLKVEITRATFIVWFKEFNTRTSKRRNFENIRLLLLFLKEMNENLNIYNKYETFHSGNSFNTKIQLNDKNLLCVITNQISKCWREKKNVSTIHILNTSLGSKSTPNILNAVARGEKRIEFFSVFPLWFNVDKSRRENTSQYFSDTCGYVFWVLSSEFWNICWINCVFVEIWSKRRI